VLYRPFIILRDNTPVNENVLSILEWASGFPTAVENDTCIALKNSKLANVPCASQTFYSDGQTNFNLPGLGYICEARPIHSHDGNKLCHFPFDYQQQTYTSCSNKPVAGFNPEGKPWCATEVTANGIVVAGKWTLCQDERTIIYKGSGAGYFCPMPFIYDRVYFDYCSRKNIVGPDGFSPFYWCPDPNHVGANNEYTAGNTIGECTEFLYPPGNKFSSSMCTIMQ